MADERTVTVLGAGYVGLTTATLLAHAGYTVYIVEPNPKRLDVIKGGRSFFYEEGIDALVKTAVKKGTLIPTDSYAYGIPKSQVVFSCVGTPDKADGSTDLTFVFASAGEAANYLSPGTIFVQKSTVPVGTGNEVKAIFAEAGKDIAYVSNPEFLRESTAVFDTLYFDRIIAGSDNRQAVEAILNIYRALEEHRDEIAAMAQIKKSDVLGKYISTDLNSAELMKVSSNAFLAVKISFANSIAKLADTVGADINEIMDGVGADPRIGRKFLNAGRGYGGGCLPKDVSGLIATGLKHGIEFEILTATQAVNESMQGYIISKIEDQLGKPLSSARIAVLGLSFKAGTNDVRKSAGIKLVNTLVGRSAEVLAFDPEAQNEARSKLDPGVVLPDTLEEATKNVDVVIIATEWPLFLKINMDELVTRMNAKGGKLFVDAVNRFDKQTIRDAGLSYIGIGR